MIRMLPIGVAVVLLTVLAACGQSAPQAPPAAPSGPAPTSNIEVPAPVGTVQARLNPTEAVGGGANSSTGVSGADLTRVFSAVPQIAQLQVSANSSPPGASGPDVTSVTIVARDGGGVLGGLDAAGKKALGDALLDAASTAWPNANVSLLVSGAAGGGQIIGSKAKGGQNTVIVS